MRTQVETSPPLPPVREIVFLEFRVGDIRLAVPIQRLNEILRYRPAQPVPNAPPFIEGLIHLRGDLIPILDLRKRFGYDAAVTRKTRILITWLQRFPIGLVVDAAHAFIRVEIERIRPLPAIPETPMADLLIAAVVQDDQIVYIPDVDMLLHPYEMQAWQEFQEQQGIPEREMTKDNASRAESAD